METAETVRVLSVSSRAPLPWKDSGCFYVDSIIPQWRGTPHWRYSDVASGRLARVEREVLQTAKHIFTMSEWARGGLVEEYGFAADRVTAVGAGPTQLRPVEDKDPATYAAKRLLFVGLDWERKGGPLLLEALRLARRVDPSITLDIAGARLPIAEDGVRLQGWLDWEELRRLYASASLFVMPSYQEAWGLVFTEAALCGLASVGLNRWATPEVIEDGVTGRVLEPEAELLAATLLEMLGDPDRLQRMGQAARARASGWTWRAVVERMLPRF
jgi:glycosyltransferase involved in cell wall biosynthesis